MARNRKDQELRAAGEETPPEEEPTSEEPTVTEDPESGEESPEEDPEATDDSSEEEEEEAPTFVNGDIPDPENQMKNMPVLKYYSFDGTNKKFKKDGSIVLSDLVEVDKGDSFDGMEAPVSEVDVPPLDQDGNPMPEGDTQPLDDPTTMQQWHVLQRFPVGTRTAVKRKKNPSSKYYEWIVWEYVSSKKLYRPGSSKLTLLTTGYNFVQVGRYDDEPPVRGRGGDIPSPPKDVVDLAAKGGYWYNGKKYP